MAKTKLQKVIDFVNRRGSFTRKQFEARFGSYSNTESTYLTYLLRAQYVLVERPGKFIVANGGPAPGMSYSQLYESAYGGKPFRF